jgi:type IV pilus assembly protein PilC
MFRDKKKNNKKLLFTIGLNKDRDYFVENLSMLVAAGMPILKAIDAIAKEMRSNRMKKVLAAVRSDIEAGAPIWKALNETGLFAEHVVSLIRLGEESGKLVENLNVVAIEQEKDRIFKSKMRSAMMYPIFVLSLTVIVGVGISWFILPKLATVFDQLRVELPMITKILIAVGVFLNRYGQYVVPAALIFFLLLFYFVFYFPKTKFIGQAILLVLPGVKKLLKEVELSRLGYLLGSLLNAGLPITQALGSLTNASDIVRYQRLYRHLSDSVTDGDSLQKSFNTYKKTNKLIPSSLQQLIVAGEQSGALAPTLLRIGASFEAKADTTTKNLAIILEPIMLVIVALGVVSVAMAVILPIYNLIGNFNANNH